jgi:CIC family chloride channel protein
MNIQRYLARLFVVNGYIPKIMLAALIGFVTGLVAIAFHEILLWVIHWVRIPWTGESPLPFWSFVLVPPLGGLICGLVIYVLTKTPEAAGQGTDNMIYAFHNQGGKIRKRVAPVKFFSSIITLGSGGSAGYEGPISQIGSGIASAIGSIFKMPRSLRGQFTLAGTAAGLGAIFKAPLAGALTSVEVLYKEDFEASAFATSIVAAVVSFTVYTASVGLEPTFPGMPDFSFINGKELLVCALLGFFCVPFSLLYVWAYNESEKRFARLEIPLFLKPALGGLFVGLLFLAYPEITGGGFGFISEMILNQKTVAGFGIVILIAVAIAKIIGTAFTVGSGGSGGVFGPSIFIGAVLGGAFAGLVEWFLPGTLREPEAMILIGMGTFFAGTSKASIAGVVMVCEMTGSYSLLPGLLIASVMHIALSRRWTIYKSQVKNKFASPVHRAEMDPDVLRVITVGEVMVKKEIQNLQASDVLNEVKSLMDSKHSFPVLDHGKYIGLLDMNAARYHMIHTPALSYNVLVSDCTIKVPLLNRSLDLHSAMRLFLRLGTTEFYVKDKTGQIVGLLSYASILKAYDQLVSPKK